MASNLLNSKLHLRYKGFHMRSKVLLIDEDSSKTDMLTASLNKAGFDVVGRVSCDDDIRAGLNICDPDVLIIDMELPDDYIFNQLIDINKNNPKPIVFFAAKGELNVIKKAIQIGVSAFIVDGLTAKRVKPVVELAFERFKVRQALYRELNDLKLNVDEIKVTECAKGILMERKKINEENAYYFLKQLASKNNKNIVDVSKSIIEFNEILI